LCFTGDKSKFPKQLQDAMQTSEQLTIENKSALLNVVVNYTGRWDILQASKSIARDIVENSLSIDDVSEQLFASRLSTNALPDPDLLIRTSGEERISNFFLWQIAYSELYFTQIAWPDFTVEEFEKALIDFESRERRFGKISTQLTEGQNV
jgi:undecaprenyl diphosphate synthase